MILFKNVLFVNEFIRLSSFRMFCMCVLYL